MSYEMMTEAVGIIDGQCETEASGGITKETIKQVADMWSRFHFRWRTHSLHQKHGY